MGACLSYVCLCLIFISTSLSGFNIRKLSLETVELTNKAHATCSITVTYQEKCPTCPRLHEKYTRTIMLEPDQTMTLSDAPNRIDEIEAHDRRDRGRLYCNFLSRNKRSGSFAIEKTENQKLLFPGHDDFLKIIESDWEFRFLKSKHPKYTTSIPSGIEREQFFNKIAELYKKNHPDSLKKGKHGRVIPGRIHTIWMGKYPMPDLYKQWLADWRRMHPGWAVIVWNTDKIREEFGGRLENQKLYDEALDMYDYATASKIVRYEILYAQGGLYIDPDIKCLESVKQLHDQYDFYAGLGSFRSYGACNNAIIGARSGHPILKAAIENIKAIYQGKNMTRNAGVPFGWTASNLGHELFTKAIYENIDRDKNRDIIFPKTVFGQTEQLVENDFCHLMPIYETNFAHITYGQETLCTRGTYSYDMGTNKK